MGVLKHYSLKIILFVSIASISGQSFSEQNWEIKTEADLTDDGRVAKATLEKVLMCEHDASPDEFIALVKSLNGVVLVKGTLLPDAHYTLPSPIEVFGRKVTRVSYYPETDGDNQYSQYSTIFDGEPVKTIASFAGIKKDSQGIYIKHIGGHDLVLRDVAETTYVECNQDVRTVRKSIARTFKNLWASIAE